MRKSLVVDASVAVKWVLEEEDSWMARSLMASRLLAPEFMLLECANVLWHRTRRGELDHEKAKAKLHWLSKAPMTFVPDHELVKPAMETALRLGHPVYDCLYVALAQEEMASLVTADRRLVETATRAGVLPGQVLHLAEAAGIQ